MAKPNPKDMLVSNPTANRTFSYSKGSVNINITVRNDIKQELKDLQDILIQCIKDIEFELQNHAKQGTKTV